MTTTSESIQYDDNTKMISGLNAGDIFRVTIIIKKEAGGYKIVSQQVKIIRKTSDNTEKTIHTIDNILPAVSSIVANGGGSLKDESRLTIFNNQVYKLPKSTKPKFKKVYNKTLSLKKMKNTHG
jgi:hypothetical protein